MVPSKLYGALASGRPVCYVGPRECEVAAVVRAHRLGWEGRNGDAEGLARAVGDLTDGEENWHDICHSARLTFEQLYDRPVCVARWIETLGEAFTLAEKAGLKVETVLDVIKALLPVPLFLGYGTRMAHSEFTPPGFGLRLGLKDVGLMRKLADQANAPLPLADIAHGHLRAALAKGRGDLDWGALITVVRELAGLEPETKR